MNPLLSLDSGKSAIKAMPKDQNIQVSDQDDSSIDFKDFLSLLLDSSSQTDKDILSLKTDDKKSISDLKDASKDAKDLSLDELLDFVTLLKSNGLQGNFPTDKEKIDNILNNEQAVKDFQDVKSIKDILNVAKKYDINIKDFKITKENDDLADLQDKNKNALMQKAPTREEANRPIQTKLQSMIDKLDNKATIKDSKPSKTSPLEHLIQTKNGDTKNLLNSKKTTVKDGQIKLKNIKNSDKDRQQDIQLSKNDLDKAKNRHSAVQTDKKISLKTDEKNQQKSVNIQQANIKTKETKAEKSDDKEKRVTRTNEAKSASKADSSEVFDKLKSFTEKNEVKHRAQTVEKATPHKTQSKTEHVATKDNPSLNNDNNIFAKNDVSIQHTTNTHHTENKAISSKQTINQFVNDLQEQIDNYKPPLMKVKMTLSPKDLGEVDVSMISRGNSLQVTISSNTNTMAIFTQNQAEFKNSLVNMGFTNLNMNFNSNGNGSNKNANGSNKNAKSYKEQNEQENESIDFVDITIPRYI